MLCNEFSERMGLWIDGERTPELEAHVRGCGECRALIADLDAIRLSAHEVTDVEPPARVWSAIRAQLDQEGLTTERGVRAWVRSLLAAWPRPAVATATLAALVAGAFLLGVQVENYKAQRSWTQGTQAVAQPIKADLGDFELHAVSALHESDPAVNVAFQKNLQIVDNYIVVCEKSVQEEPENELARDYLYGAYQQKADLLAQMSERGENPQ
jgi:anti-sigma factor RsiW